MDFLQGVQRQLCRHFLDILQIYIILIVSTDEQ
jgi:hypothetical protein